MGVSGRHLLIVDDERILRFMLERYLAKVGWQCHVAGDPEEAVSLLEREAITHALVDLHLGAVSGTALIQMILKRWPTVRIVAMTGSVISEGGIEWVAGAERVLTKPFAQLAEVADALEECEGARQRP